MKRLGNFIILLTLLIPFVLPIQTTEASLFDLDFVIAPGSNDMLVFTTGPIAMFTVELNPVNESLRYDVVVEYYNSTIILNRCDKKGHQTFNLIGNEEYYLSITNQATSDLEINVVIYRDLIYSHEESGYTFEIDMYRCWDIVIDPFEFLIIPIESLNRGLYTAYISVFDDEGHIEVHYTTEDPITTTLFYDVDYLFSLTTYGQREVSIGSKTDWLVLRSLDGQPHQVVIYMVREQRILWTTLEIVGALAIVVAVGVFIYVRKKSR